MPGWPAHVEHALKNAAAAASADRPGGRARALIGRYPNVSAIEATEILSYVKKAGYLELQLLASDDSVRRQFELFLKSHKRELRYSPAEIMTIAAMVIAFLAFCWLLWHPLGGN